ncbi:hypothetical protein BKA83DRAFT_14985 [Pisolithus microcarpus]|nr:hypothetical protein BKA83DRAFT_14985 [Pisolithus microcarpus]
MDDVSRERKRLKRFPPGHAGRYFALYNLALGLCARFKKERQINDLNEAITLHRDALELRPVENEEGDRSDSLHQLAFCLWYRYHELGAVVDLEEAIALGREALALRPPGHPRRDSILNNLGVYLRTRFEKQAEVRDLEEAIQLLRAALELRPPGHQRRSSTLSQLILCLSSRYESQGLVKDLEELVALRRAVLELFPREHSDHVASLHNLSCDLRRRYAKTAAINDLEESIELHRTALELRTPGHRHRSSTLHELALCLSTRYDQLGMVADLEEAIESGRAAMKLLTRWHPSRGEYLHNLACNLRKRFVKQAAMQDLEEAIELLRSALELHPVGHPDRSSSLYELIFCLSRRRDKYRVVEDLEAAVTLGREILELCPQGHPDRASFLHDLAQCLADRFRRQPTAADLDEAIVLEQETLDILVCGDPSYDISLRCLMDYVQMKIKAQVTVMSSIASGVTHFDVDLVIRNTAFETLKTMPTRLLHTHTGILCNRDAQVSRFLSSPHCKHLVSLCKTRDRNQQMELIRTEVPRHFQYATLSHRWGADEPSLRDIEGRKIYNMSAIGALGKLQGFCAVACRWGYSWAWSDTCCIDKHSSAEVQETIGSMFAWYRQSALTIVYLSDVPGTGSLGSSEWFRRGWTLQELLAPRTVLFYTQNWSLYKNLTSANHKEDATVLAELARETGIEPWFLFYFSPGVDNARSRLQWASSRLTTRPEDIAYSLFGIFNLHLPVLYGESAEHALGRLLTEIVSQSGDTSVLDWVGEPSPFHSCFPAHIKYYRRLPPRLNATEHSTAISEGLSSFAVLRDVPGKPTVRPVQLRTPDSHVLGEVHDIHSPARVPLARFFGRLLALPCISYQVTAIQLKGADPSAPNYTYNVQATGLTPLDIALSAKLEDVTRSQDGLYLVRPWHSKLLGPFTALDAVADEQLVSALWTPFNALLLTQLRYNEYKRIASSTLITAHPLDRTSVLNSEVRAPHDDSNFKPIRADYARDVLTERLGLGSRVSTLGHIQRSGRLRAFDRILPTLQGIEAVKAVLEATPDTPSYMIGVRENKITRVPLMEVVEMTRAVADAAKDFAKAMSLRDPEFLQSLEGFMTTSLLYKEKMLSEEKRMRVAIMHIGAPAGGMNAATRAAVRYSIKQGHIPLAVHNGFKGLLDDAIHELSRLGVDGWTSRGGSELGTNRTLPSVDLGAVAARFQQHDFHALMLIGGFEAFNSLLILENGRSLYPAFHIPMVHLPATISNNVPMTEFSLGSDMSLNALVDACDAIKQSASASRNRVFVVETQGGQCGYIAAMGALATGASLVYTPEQGMDLDMLRADVKFLKIRYGLDAKGKSEGRLVIRNECASKVYTTDMLTDMFREEGGGLFDSRYASLGHILQGGVPTPMDRARAARLSLRCMAFLEEHHQSLLAQPPKSRCAPPESAAVITIQGSALKWVPVTEMVKHADMKNRRGREAWWEPVKGWVEALSGRSELV